MRRMSLTCSGLCAEAAAALVSSLRSSSTCCRCHRSSRAPYCSLLNRRAEVLHGWRGVDRRSARGDDARSVG